MNFQYGSYFPDIINFEKKIVVEYYGNAVHANPVKYSGDDYNVVCKKKTNKQIWDNDAKRQAFIEGQGWIFIVVWENEWKFDKKKVLERICSYIK